MKSIFNRFLPAAIALAALPVVAKAQTPAPDAKVFAACAKEIEAFHARQVTPRGSDVYVIARPFDEFAEAYNLSQADRNFVPTPGSQGPRITEAFHMLSGALSLSRAYTTAGTNTPDTVGGFGCCSNGPIFSG
jgi:hypothetical protein